MPDAPATTPETPATEAAPTAEAAPIEASASPSTTEAAPETPSVDIDAWIRGMASSRVGPTLNPDGVVPTAELTSETAPDESASSSDEGVTTGEQTPPDGQAQPGRRARAAQAAQDRIAELEARVSEYEQPAYRDRVRQELLAEQAQQSTAAQSQADAERFTRLMRTPDAELSAEDYAWREDQKELLSRYPQAQAMYDRLVAQEREALYADLQGKQQAFWHAARNDLDGARSLPHVDAEAVRSAPSFSARDRLVHAAGAAWKEAELSPKVAALEVEAQRLRDELADARLGNLGRAAAPFGGGQSAGPSSSVDIDTWIRRQAGMA